MHASGVALEEIGDYVGHSSAYMTDRYRHLIEGQREAAAARFDEYAANQLGAPGITGTSSVLATVQ